MFVKFYYNTTIVPKKKASISTCPSKKLISSQEIQFLQNVTNMEQKNIKTKPTHFIIVLNGQQIISENIGDMGKLIINKKNEINIILSKDSKCSFTDDLNGNKIQLFLQ